MVHLYDFSAITEKRQTFKRLEGIENAVLDKIVSQDLEKHGNHLIMG